MLWFAGRTALTLDACLVQVTGTRRRDSAGTSKARAALLGFYGSSVCLKSLLQRLQELSFSEKEYWVVAGAAMVLYGFRPQTHDVVNQL